MAGFSRPTVPGHVLPQGDGARLSGTQASHNSVRLTTCDLFLSGTFYVTPADGGRCGHHVRGRFLGALALMTKADSILVCLQGRGHLKAQTDGPAEVRGPVSRGGRKVAWGALHRLPPTDHVYPSLCKPRLSRWPGLGREPRGGQGSGSGEAGALGVGLALGVRRPGHRGAGRPSPLRPPPCRPTRPPSRLDRDSACPRPAHTAGHQGWGVQTPPGTDRAPGRWPLPAPAAPRPVQAAGQWRHPPRPRLGLGPGHACASISCHRDSGLSRPGGWGRARAAGAGHLCRAAPHDLTVEASGTRRGGRGCVGTPGR